MRSKADLVTTCAAMEASSRKSDGRSDMRDLHAVLTRAVPDTNHHVTSVDVGCDRGELAKRPWFAGHEISAANIMMSFPLEAAQSRDLVGKERRNIRRWLEQIHDRPAYKKALARGGTYRFA